MKLKTRKIVGGSIWLNKTIYGLKQSGRAWNNKLHTALLEIGFKQFSRDHCVYFDVNKHRITILAVYVDDLLIFTNDTEKEENLKGSWRNLKLRILDQLKVA